MKLPYCCWCPQVIPIHQPVHDGAADQYITLLVEHPTSSSSSGDKAPDNPDPPALPYLHLLPNSPAAADEVWLKQQQQGWRKNPRAAEVLRNRVLSDDCCDLLDILLEINEVRPVWVQAAWFSSLLMATLDAVTWFPEIYILYDIMAFMMYFGHWCC